ncbi:Ferredoxin-thioredoxin reductase catalytic chain, chloroplastic [Linum perenne]
MTLQATSCSFAGVSSFPAPPSTASHRHRHHLRTTVVRAQAVDPKDKSVEIMRKFSEQYARRSGTYFCADKGVTSVVIKGLAEHKDSLGAPLCPCRQAFSSTPKFWIFRHIKYCILKFSVHDYRHYDDKAAEAGQGFWNCPCVPMRERKECHCMLFLTPDNDFAGKDQTISLEEIKEATSNM